MSLKLIFMGTPDFAVPTLRALNAQGHDIKAVYCQPPRAAGRGMALRKSAVQQEAESLGLEVRTPTSLKDPQAQKDFADLKADAAIVVAYGLLLPKPVLEAVPLGCYNLHPSLLPRWRGAAPLQRAIMAGDQETAVAIMRMQEGLDTGPICREEKFPLDDHITASMLHDALAEKGAKLMCEGLDQLEKGTLRCVDQALDGVTYAEKISKQEALIDFTKKATQVLRHIHGLSPFPGAFVEVDGQRIKILTAEFAQSQGEPGTILDDDLAIACGQGAIRPLFLQRRGKQAMGRAEFLRGLHWPKGMRLIHAAL